MDPIDSDSAYAVAKSFEDDEVIEQSAEVLEEEERIRNEEQVRGNPQSTGVGLEDDLSESEGEEDQMEEQNTSKSTGTTQLNPVQKVSQVSCCQLMQTI